MELGRGFRLAEKPFGKARHPTLVPTFSLRTSPSLLDKRAPDLCTKEALQAPLTLCTRSVRGDVGIVSESQQKDQRVCHAEQRITMLFCFSK
jgi:hypothetical protein